MLWDHFKPYLERATLRRATRADEFGADARELVRDGKLMLVHIFDALETQAVAACELLELNDGRALHIRWLGGSNIDGWIDELHEGLRTLANANKCRWVTLNGRPGWRKILKSHGMTPVAITLRAEVY